MYGVMNSQKTEYGVQPAYNESLLPICPPSYSEAVASSFRSGSNTYQLPYPKQPGSLLEPQLPPTNYPNQPQIQVVQSPNFAVQPQTITLPVAVGPNPSTLKCPHCLTIVRTKTTTGVKRSAHYCCCLLFFCGCILCSCIPYCLASFKNVHHTCPNCNGFIGTYRP